MPDTGSLAERRFELLDDAVAWGRTHALVVLVRQAETPTKWLSAGEIRPVGHELEGWQAVTAKPGVAYDIDGLDEDN